MEHVAIMNSKAGFLEKIISGKKIIESRWYKTKRKELSLVKINEKIYFKNSGKPVNLKAEIKNVMIFEDLNQEKAKEILEKYGKLIGITDEIKESFYESVKNSKYCMLIFLENIQEIEKFNIDKKGFGNMTAFLSINHITDIKI